MRLTSTATWRDPRVIAWLLAVLSASLVASAAIGDLSVIGDLLLAAVIAVPTTAAFARYSAPWPADLAPWTILIPIFLAESVVMCCVWILIRTR